MPQADLEIFVSQHSAGDFGVTLRFRHPEAGQNTSASGSFALDEAALGQLQHDTTALVMQAAPGEELVRRAHYLPSAHPAAPRGVIAHFATLPLARAVTAGDWLAGIDLLVQQEAQTNRLPPFYRPQLALHGDVNRRLPGAPERVGT